jgi:hypothetical protein
MRCSSQFLNSRKLLKSSLTFIIKRRIFVSRGKNKKYDKP